MGNWGVVLSGKMKCTGITLFDKENIIYWLGECNLIGSGHLRSAGIQFLIFKGWIPAARG